jgi:hypothetical protein
MVTTRRALAGTVFIGLEAARFDVGRFADYEWGVSAVTLGELRFGVLQAYLLPPTAAAPFCSGLDGAVACSQSRLFRQAKCSLADPFAPAPACFREPARLGTAGMETG